MEKKEYVTPKVLEHGDVKEITLAGGTTVSSIDAVYTNPDGTTWATFSGS